MDGWPSYFVMMQNAMELYNLSAEGRDYKINSSSSWCLPFVDYRYHSVFVGKIEEQV